MLHVDIRRVTGDNIRFIREKKGLTQEALAFEADVARSYIGYIERAEKTLSIVTLTKIAKALKVKPGLLLEPKYYENF
jgi:transcriptional regulator with XRE-family HTH domain